MEILERWTELYFCRAMITMGSKQTGCKPDMLKPGLKRATRAQAQVNRLTKPKPCEGDTAMSQSLSNIVDLSVRRDALTGLAILGRGYLGLRFAPAQAITLGAFSPGSA
jgi:hypothetical protein